MAQLIRILNAFAAALFVVMALVSLAFLASGRGDVVALPGGWAALFLLLAALAFLNLRRRLPALNLVAALPLVAGALALDGTARLLCAAASLPFALTLLLLLAARRAD
jgi:hypothetical protein